MIVLLSSMDRGGNRGTTFNKILSLANISFLFKLMCMCVDVCMCE